MTEQIETHSPCEHVIKSRRVRSGILTQEDIEYYGVINGLDKECLNAASYDLRLDDRHLVYNHRQNQWECVYIGKDQSIENLNDQSPMPVNYKDSLVLPRFGTAIIQLKEMVNTHSCLGNVDYPTIICGRFDLKLKMTMKNLTSQQATQVEPGYYGKLYCLITNQSDKDIVLEEDTKIATIEFSYANTFECETLSKLLKVVTETNKRKYNKTNSDIPKMYCNDDGINDVRFFMTEKYAHSSQGSLNTLVSQQDMKDFVGLEIDKIVENKVKWYKDSTEHSIRAIQWFITACLAILLFMAREIVTTIKDDVKNVREKVEKVVTADKDKVPITPPEKPKANLPSINTHVSNRSAINPSATYAPQNIKSENTPKIIKMHGYTTASCSSVLNFNINCNK